MVKEKQLKELFKYIEHNWEVCVSQVDKTDIKRIFGGVLCEDIMNDTDQVTDQEPEQVQHATEMTYEEAVKHIISNKLTHKKAGSDSWYAYKFYGYNIHFCDENGKDMILVRFDELDLHEWYPCKKPFDKDRFERMFCAVVASGRTERWEQDFKFTEEAIAKLDAYYAEKEKGGNNDTGK